MSETIVSVLQGVATGIGILAAGVGLFAASATGGNFHFVVNGQVIAFNAPAARSHTAAVATPAPEADAPTDAAAAPVEVASDKPSEPPVAPATIDAQPLDLSYYNETAADLSLLVVSLKRMGVLLAAPQPADDVWQTEIRIVSDAVRQSVENLALVQPGDASIDLHSFLMSAAGRCRRVALALDGDLTQLPEETFQLIGDTLAGCSQDAVSVLQQINGRGK